MISPDMIAFIIASFCQIKNPQITKTEKLECIEYMTNCIVRENGKTTDYIMDQCKTMYAERSKK